MKCERLLADWILRGLCIIALSACHSAPTRLYSLTSIASPDPVVRYGGSSVRIDSVHLPAEMDRAEIITRVTVATTRYRIHEQDHWAAPLSALAREALTSDLISRLPPGKVIVAPLDKPAGGIGIEVGIVRVSTDGGTQFVASWQLKAGRVVIAGPESFTLDDAAEAATPGQVADRLSDVLARIADRIATQLSTSAAFASPG